MLGRNAQILDHRVLEGTRNGGIEEDVLCGEDVAEGKTPVGRDDDVVQVLGTDAVGEVGECTPIVGEEKVQVGEAGEEARIDDTRNRTARVKGEFLDNLRGISLRKKGVGGGYMARN